ncbi:hypothetical protein LJC46_03425 [Desulfovibrio sp. OttesenSCG-928-G15]|nr:hypothetical protein [Desulfovibrio sp. OttesenSCG-928-G15]
MGVVAADASAAGVSGADAGAELVSLAVAVAPAPCVDASPVPADACEAVGPTVFLAERERGVFAGAFVAAASPCATASCSALCPEFCALLAGFAALRPLAELALPDLDAALLALGAAALSASLREDAAASDALCDSERGALSAVAVWLDAAFASALVVVLAFVPAGELFVVELFAGELFTVGLLAVPVFFGAGRRRFFVRRRFGGRRLGGSLRIGLRLRGLVRFFCRGSFFTGASGSGSFFSCGRLGVFAVGCIDHRILKG